MLSLITLPWLVAQRAFLRWSLWETEGYLAACARDGLVDSLSLREFRGQVSDMRVRLALLDARIHTRRALRRPVVNRSEEAA